MRGQSILFRVICKECSAMPLRAAAGPGHLSVPTVAACPIMALNSAVVLVWGTARRARPRRAARRSAPTRPPWSTRAGAPPGSSARTCSLCRSKAAVMAARSPMWSSKRVLEEPESWPSSTRRLAPPSGRARRRWCCEQLVNHESGSRDREEHQRVGVGRRELRPEARPGPVDLRRVALMSCAQSTGRPSMASVHTGTSSGWPNTSIMW